MPVDSEEMTEQSLGGHLSLFLKLKWKPRFMNERLFDRVGRKVDLVL